MSKTVIYSLIGLLVVVAVAGVALGMSRNVRRGQDSQTGQPAVLGTPLETTMSPSAPSASSVTWQQTGEGWQAVGATPAACPSPFVFQPPADLSKATAVLYPGQTRGGNYKPHGGLRFDSSKNTDITVTAPYAAQVVRGGRYLVNGEIQYTFDFITDCGIMYRLGHLLVLTPAFQTIADKFPAAQEGDSRTSRVEPAVAVKAGDVIATSVGITKGGETNTFFDWGVYDTRSKNEISKDGTWLAQHKDDVELAQHAVCWFDWLSSTDSVRIKSLPAGDPTSGKKSDYCK